MMAAQHVESAKLAQLDGTAVKAFDRPTVLALYHLEQF
jgi:hypothetical protein